MLFSNFNMSCASLPLPNKQCLIYGSQVSFLRKMTGDGTTPSALGTVTPFQADTCLPHILLCLNPKGKK